MCTIHGFQEFILPCWHGCHVCKLQVTHKHMAWHATHCFYVIPCSPIAITPHHMNPCMHAHSMYVMSWYHICMSTLACQNPMGNIFPFQISHPLAQHIQSEHNKLWLGEKFPSYINNILNFNIWDVHKLSKCTWSNCNKLVALRRYKHLRLDD